MRPLMLRASGRTFRPAPRRRGRQGFTLVEVIVAIVMLAAGVLALVSSSAVVLLEMNTGSQHAAAASVAAQRLERLRSFDSCAQLTAGTGTTRGMTESWTVAPVFGNGGQASRTITYSVGYQAGRARRTQQFITNIPCT